MGIVRSKMPQIANSIDATPDATLKKSRSISSKNPNFTLVEMSIDSELKFGAE